MSISMSPSQFDIFRCNYASWFFVFVIMKFRFLRSLLKFSSIVLGVILFLLYSRRMLSIEQVTYYCFGFHVTLYLLVFLYTDERYLLWFLILGIPLLCLFSVYRSYCHIESSIVLVLLITVIISTYCLLILLSCSYLFTVFNVSSIGIVCKGLVCVA
jgi:hypothetical protein